MAVFLSLGITSGAIAGSALMAPAPQAKAESGVIDSTNAETEVRLNLLPTISLSVADESIDIDILPNSYAHGSTEVEVDSNSANGYSVYVSMQTSDTNLNHENASLSAYKINAISENVALSVFKSGNYANKWGFVHKVNNVDTISPIPYLGTLMTNLADNCDVTDANYDYATCTGTNQAIVNGTEDSEATAAEIAEKKATHDAAILCTDDDDTCTLDIGVKIDSSLPSGIYSNTIVVTAVPNLGS